MEILAWSISSHIKDIRHEKPLHRVKVAFITTIVPSKESLSLLTKCLPAMKNASYKHDTWILDEENNSEVQEMCKKYGVNHYSRYGRSEYNTDWGKFKKHTKGGNHNSWYEEFGNSYDFVAQIDTDFVPKKSFLTKTLGYFRDPKVGFVGTPQIYANKKSSFIAKGAAEQTYNFYGTILRGLSGMDMALLIGANHVIRVSALKQIGHYSAHITEDLLTGMKFHANGWKSIYLPYPLAYGEGPVTWKAYFNQQMRWSYGCIDIFFNHSPHIFKKMNLRQIIYYFFLQLHYFSGLAVGLSILLLSLYFFAGINDANLRLIPFLIFYFIINIFMWIMSLWLQRYNVHPREERGLLIPGMVVSMASWPIFFVALISVLMKKRLSYKITPKGSMVAPSENHLLLFMPHYLFGTMTLTDLISALFTHRQNPIMIYWAYITTLLLFSLPVAHLIIAYCSTLKKIFKGITRNIYQNNLLFEFKNVKKTILPNPPSIKEKYKYIKRNNNWILLFSIISFSGVSVSMFNFLSNNPFMWILFGYFGLTVIYFLVSMVVSNHSPFNIILHNKIIFAWEEHINNAKVDIFLPTAGEPINVLKNTWEGVKEIKKYFKGKIEIYCLDDSGRPEVKELANIYDFHYEVRENRGYFKKAGNLRHGFSISNGDFITIFDADFRPRKDFLNELLPYFYEDTSTGIVQSPQYFEVNFSQNWLERGAGAVQEFFYRFSQVARQNHDASICVGSNAIYRRSALNEIGGTALVEHSEDVHTGFNLRTKGWTIQYVPIILAKGLCPSEMNAFFKQQYRWCRGSMTLLNSKKFWSTKLRLRTRLCYFSGFLYYIHTAISSFIIPVIPLSLLIIYPSQVKFFNLLFIIPSFVFVLLIYPLWHYSVYGIEAWSTRLIYGWAHLFAIFDTLINKSMTWQPTGIKSIPDRRYFIFRILQFIFNFIPAIMWISISARYVMILHNFAFIPILLGGVYFFLVIAKTTFYTSYTKECFIERKVSDSADTKLVLVLDKLKSKTVSSPPL